MLVLVLPEPEYEERQLRRMMAFCIDRGITVTAVTRSAEDAVALAAGRLVDAIVAVMADADGVLATARCRVHLLDPHRRPRSEGGTDPEMVLIRQMLGRGGTPETVAHLLGIDLDRVRRASGGLPAQRAGDARPSRARALPSRAAAR